MKQILSLLEPHVIRAILRSCVTKVVVALCVILLWNRLINEDSLTPRGIIDTGFFALSVWFILGAWMHYLSLDGVHPFRHLHERNGSSDKQKRFRLANLFGYENRSIRAMDEEVLDDEEATVAKLCSDLLAAAFFLIPCLIVSSL